MSHYWKRLSGPVKVGIFFAVLAIVLSLSGIIRNPDIDFNVRTFFIATVIAGGTWGLISWAIAEAIVDVESDIAEQENVDVESPDAPEATEA